MSQEKEEKKVDDLRNMHGFLSWGELTTSDPRKAQSFYESLFGWDFQQTVNTCGANYTVILKEQNPLGGMLKLSDLNLPENIPPHWAIYFAVDDLDTSLLKVMELGGQILMGKTPLRNGSFFACIRDPQGAYLGLVEPPQ